MPYGTKRYGAGTGGRGAKRARTTTGRRPARRTVANPYLRQLATNRNQRDTVTEFLSRTFQVSSDADGKIKMVVPISPVALTGGIGGGAEGTQSGGFTEFAQIAQLYKEYALTSYTVVLVPQCLNEAGPDGASPMVSLIEHSESASSALDSVASACKQRMAKLHGTHASLCDKGQSLTLKFSAKELDEVSFRSTQNSDANGPAPTAFIKLVAEGQAPSKAMFFARVYAQCRLRGRAPLTGN
jgi:hypothetical protein